MKLELKQLSEEKEKLRDLKCNLENFVLVVSLAKIRAKEMVVHLLYVKLKMVVGM